ncbi:hypothetical protein G6011_03804 [Alternaria panax]|uniref:Uncharacterized protein n=1 Tax=Alternaria panax TaxID=48097 RepID=A0AAD4IFX3_9PLEO|nr:hypothetical protein G6011_03804 [Alternaria panax]
MTGLNANSTPHPLIARNNDVQNSTNGQGGSQTLENPFTTNFLTDSAPIYNQNANSGFGQQNIKVNGNFEVPSSYTPAAAPHEYEVRLEPERHEQRGSGSQKFDVSNGIKNKTAGDDRSGGYSQTLTGPHDHTHLRTMAPVYNQNVNSGSGQQNINVKGRMGFQKQGSQEPTRQGPAAGQLSQLPAQNRNMDLRPQWRNDQGLDHHESGPAYSPGQTSPPIYRSHSPARVAPHSQSGYVVPKPPSRNRYRDRRDGYEDEYNRDRSTYRRSVHLLGLIRIIEAAL